MAANKKPFCLCLFLLLGVAHNSLGQSARFNFSSASHIADGWTNVDGDPSYNVITVMAPSGISVNSVATANWSELGGNSAFDGLGDTVNGVFPAAVLVNHWFNYENPYHTGQPQLKLTGLSRDSLYTLKMAGSSTSTVNTDFTSYTVVGLANYGVIAVNSHNNSTDCAIFNRIAPDSTGSIYIYLNNQPWSQSADICGLVITVSPPLASNLAPGIGVAAQGTTLALGDSVTGIGPHSFTANRYQYLNGYQYSIGGSVKDAVNHPVLRQYSTGDLAFSTTMDTSVNTDAQTGLRYYPMPGILQVGATDRMDTTMSASAQQATWRGGGILVNSSDSGGLNTVLGEPRDVYIAGGSHYIDSSANLYTWLMNGGAISVSNGVDDDNIVSGYGMNINGTFQDNLVTGNAHNFTNYTILSSINGFMETAQDTSLGCIVSGSGNRFGGWWQMTTGVNLTNRSPNGAIMGSGNVDFSTLPYATNSWQNGPNLSSYPVFAIGNAGSGSVQSNAMTVLYSGRTQINTTGSLTGLTQPAVTPQAALDVVSNNSGVLFPRLTTGQQNAITTGDLHNGLLLYNTDSSAFQFYNGSTWMSVSSMAAGRWMTNAAFTYDSLDNVSIGTSSTQGYKFAVNGDAVLTNVITKPPASWPDVVFSRGYRLPAPVQVEQYVKAHHHLPGVASEEEVRREGADMAEQQAALLKKVEELTLYVIHLEKEAGALEKDNVRLRKQYSKKNKNK